MKCPYCSEEMEKGYIKSSHAMHWSPDRTLGFVGNDISLAKPTWKGMAEGLFVDSCYCKKCGKIIVSLE